MIRRLDEHDVVVARFEVGQVVCHKHYEYRGVIVAFDKYCMAPESWYLKNQTQPQRYQPWYHVLVHQSMTATYAAEENLVGDESGQPIKHALTELYFGSFVDGKYLRNDEPWQGWHA